MNALERMRKKYNSSQIADAISFWDSEGFSQEAEEAALEFEELNSDLEALRAKLQACEALVTEWRTLNDEYPMPTDRQIGIEFCADELEAALKGGGQ